MSGTFDGIGNTELYEKGVYLTPGGAYELEVQTMLLKKTRKSGLGFIVEFKILAVEGEEAETKHAIGSKATWFQGMDDTDVAFPAIKEFMLALLNIDRKDEEAYSEFNDSLAQLLRELTAPVEAGEEHAMKGERIHCDTYSKLTKKNQDFTVHMWSVSGEIQ